MVGDSHACFCVGGGGAEEGEGQGEEGRETGGGCLEEYNASKELVAGVVDFLLLYIYV